MRVQENILGIDRRVAYGAALVIALGGVAASCELDERDAGDGRVGYVIGSAQHETQTTPVYPEMGAQTFDLQTLNLVEVSQP